MNANKVLTKDYENVRLHRRPKTNPKQTQFKPNLLNAQMNANKILTKDYENVRLHGRSITKEE